MFQTGNVNTDTVRSWQAPQSDNPMPVQFPSPHPTPPPVLTGLNYLDISSCANARIESAVQDVRTDGMVINMRSWADTVQHNAGCAWLVPPPTDDDFQHGHFATGDDHPPHSPKRQTSRRIAFPRPYAAPPTVIVWLDMLDVDSGANCRVRAYTTDVTRDAFTVHVDTWQNSKLYGAGVYWAAHSAGRRDICSGTFATGDVRHFSKPRLDTSKSLVFTDAEFDAPPQLFLALNSIDVDCYANLRLKVYARDVTSTGMIWHIDGWENTIVYSAGVAFIAVPAA